MTVSTRTENDAHTHTTDADPKVFFLLFYVFLTHTKNTDLLPLGRLGRRVGVRVGGWETLRRLGEEFGFCGHGSGESDRYVREEEAERWTSRRFFFCRGWCESSNDDGRRRRRDRPEVGIHRR